MGRVLKEILYFKRTNTISLTKSMSFWTEVDCLFNMCTTAWLSQWNVICVLASFGAKILTMRKSGYSSKDWIPSFP